MARKLRPAAGATQPGFLDVLTAAVLLALLLYAAWKQFPAFNPPPAQSPPAHAARSADRG